MFRANLRTLHPPRHLTLEALATATGPPRPYRQTREMGAGTPATPILARLAPALRVPLALLTAAAPPLAPPLPDVGALAARLAGLAPADLAAVGALGARLTSGAPARPQPRPPATATAGPARRGPRPAGPRHW